MAIKVAMWLGLIWWRIRGVGIHDYGALCSRCQCTGQMHWHLRPMASVCANGPICPRFKRRMDHRPLF